MRTSNSMGSSEIWDKYQECCIGNGDKFHKAKPSEIYHFQYNTHVCFSLSKVMNKSVMSGSLPFDWISANIVPVHKRNDRHLPENYHPISLTSVVVKVLEHIIHQQLYSALRKNGSLSRHQYSFQRNRSTVALLLQAVDD